MYKVISALLLLVLVIVLVYYNLFVDKTVTTTDGKTVTTVTTPAPIVAIIAKNSLYTPYGTVQQQLYDETMKFISLVKPYYCYEAKVFLDTMNGKLYESPEDSKIPLKTLTTVIAEIKEYGAYLKTPQPIIDQYIVVTSILYNYLITNGQADVAHFRTFMSDIYNGFCDGVALVKPSDDQKSILGVYPDIVANRPSMLKNHQMQNSGPQGVVSVASNQINSTQGFRNYRRDY
jgi:hypothetical protein